jgi:N-carbamoyl-L-amino-acid hydrolase
VQEHAVTRISGHVSFSLEARSLNSYTLTAFAEEIMATAHQVSEARGVTFRFDSPVLTEPATLDHSVFAALKHSCEALAVNHLELASGAAMTPQFLLARDPERHGVCPESERVAQSA